MRGDSCDVDFLKFRDIFATLEYHMKKITSAAMETGRKEGYIRIQGAAAGRHFLQTASTPMDQIVYEGLYGIICDYNVISPPDFLGFNKA